MEAKVDEEKCKLLDTNCLDTPMYQYLVSKITSMTSVIEFNAP